MQQPFLSRSNWSGLKKGGKLSFYAISGDVLLSLVPADIERMESGQCADWQRAILSKLEDDWPDRSGFRQSLLLPGFDDTEDADDVSVSVVQRPADKNKLAEELKAACAQVDAAELEELLWQGGDPDSEKSPLLLKALRNDFEQGFRLLFQARADVKLMEKASPCSLRQSRKASRTLSSCWWVAGPT